MAHSLRAVVLHHQATAELTEARGILIHIDRGHVLVPAPQDVTAHGQDQFPPGPDPDLLSDDAVVGEIVLVGMVVEDEEVRVIVATAVMMIEAGAEVVGGVEGADVKVERYLSWRWAMSV